MPKLASHIYDTGDGLKFRMPFDLDAETIPVEDWKNQIMVWFDKKETDIPDQFTDDAFQAIKKALHKVNNNVEVEFGSYFIPKAIDCKGEMITVYEVKAGLKQRVYELISMTGFYKLTVYDFIKTIADKRGAHIDIAIPLMITTFNDSKRMSAIEVFAIEMIMQAQKQIPELTDYGFVL